LQTTTTTQAYDTYDSHNAIFDQQSMSNNNVTVSDQQYQQLNIASPNQNHQQQYQYIHQPNIPNNTVTITPDNNYQQSMSNNNVTISTDNNHHASNNIPNNVLPPQQNQPSDSSQSNILPLLNSFGINISSPQATIIIMPTTNSDIQNQLQQVLAYLNRSQQ
jgi:hypothetical protein